jgi:hypothetical protein
MSTVTLTRKINGQMCVEALKVIGCYTTAADLAKFIGWTDSRAVATALRKPVDEGRVKIRYKRGLGLGAHYKFVRLSVKKVGAA